MTARNREIGAQVAKSPPGTAKSLARNGKIPRPAAETPPPGTGPARTPAAGRPNPQSSAPTEIPHENKWTPKRVYDILSLSVQYA